MVESKTGSDDEVLQTVILHPRGVMLWSKKTLSLFFKRCTTDILYFDATGSVIQEKNLIHIHTMCMKWSSGTRTKENPLCLWQPMSPVTIQQPQYSIICSGFRLTWLGHMGILPIKDPYCFSVMAPWSCNRHYPGHSLDSV